MGVVMAYGRSGSANSLVVAVLPFIILMVGLNSAFYGIVLYSEWGELGKFVDTLDFVDKIAPFLGATIISLLFSALYSAFADLL